MAEPDESNIDYVRRYGDSPNAPDVTPVNAVDRAAPYDATQDFLNAATIKGNVTGGVLPGVGGPRSTNVTDLTNMNVAAAMERADLANRTIQPDQLQGQIDAPITSAAMDHYAQARQEVDTQKLRLMAKLGMVPPSAGGFAAVVMPSQQRGRHGEPSEYDIALGQLHELDNHSKQLAQEHHYAATDNFREAQANLKQSTAIQVASGGTKLTNAILQAQTQFPDDYNKQKLFVLQTAVNDPDIQKFSATANGAKKLAPYTDLQHSAAAIKANIVASIAAHKAAGLPIGSVETTATGGVNVRGPTSGKAETIPAGIRTDYSRLQADLAEKQGYLATEKYQPNIDKLKGEMRPMQARIKSLETQYPHLGGQTTQAPTTVKMQSPDGKVKNVSPDQVDHYKKLGATVIQ